ncbi:MAG: hypothetical protein ACRDJU_04285 [Actinomycetota bacterium]
MSLPWKPALVALAAIVVVGGAILLATHRGSAPTRLATRHPSPSVTGPAASLTAPGGRSSAPPATTPEPHGTSPASTQAPPATPGRKASPASPAPTLPAGLVAGAYGFAYPTGWVPGPLVVRNSLVTTETVTDPSGTGRIDYMKESSTAIYNPDRTVNDTYIETAIEAALPCNIIVGVTPEPNVGFRYVCSADQGIQITGNVLIAPYAHGARIVQVTIPLAQGDTAVAILNAFH